MGLAPDSGVAVAPQVTAGERPWFWQQARRHFLGWFSRGPRLTPFKLQTVL